MAITALVCGLAQFLLWFILLVPGLLAAFAGLRQIKQRGDRGKGMAIAGIVLGVLGVLGGIFWVIVLAVGAHVRYRYHFGHY